MFTSQVHETDIVASLAIEAVQQGYTLWFRVASGSMRPLLQIDDAVHIHPVQIDEIRIGDIAAIVTAQGLLIHRIVHRQPGGRFVQMGDGEIRPGWIERSAIIGKVIAIRHSQTIIDLQRPLARRWSKTIAMLRYWRFMSSRSRVFYAVVSGCAFVVHRVGCWCVQIFCRSSQLETLSA